MTDSILQAYREVEMAMERFTLVLHDHVDHLRKTEAPSSDKLHRMANGTKAAPMRRIVTKYLLGMPPTKNIANTTGIQTRQEPKSGCSKIINHGAPTIAPDINIRRMGCNFSNWLNASARTIIAAIKASWEG